MYRLIDLKGVFLVFCATDSGKLNREVSREARKRRIMANVVDSPKDCDFISPSLIERGHLKVSISTGGLAPLLSKKLREELEERLGTEYRQYTELIARVRNAILEDEGWMGVIPGAFKFTLQPNSRGWVLDADFAKEKIKKEIERIS